MFQRDFVAAALSNRGKATRVGTVTNKVLTEVKGPQKIKGNQTDDARWREKIEMFEYLFGSINNYMQ